MNDQNDYYNIRAMSAAFRKWDSEQKLDDLSLVERMNMWHLRFALSIAQQLSMVSAHLGKIVSKAEGGETK